MGHTVETTLDQAKNIGKTLKKRLNEIGIFTLADLTETTPAVAYSQMKSLRPNKTLPVCYYLYSLQGALLDIHWNKLPQSMKEELRRKAQRQIKLLHAPVF